MNYLENLRTIFTVMLILECKSDPTSAGETNTTSSPNILNITRKHKDGDWIQEALRDIAYYLRAHKFNEYDRRYETQPLTAPRKYFQEFPRPPLRSLHWEVNKFCDSSFMECIDYLRKRIRYTSSKRDDDTAVVIQEQKWTNASNSEQIKQVDEECVKSRQKDDTRADPFEGPLERFQWRVTASYFMCWFTMKQMPELEHLSESCDNFANCLDSDFGPNNHDERAADYRPYSCALYSFCPDPCCPNKHLTGLENCWNSPENPCFQNNPAGQRECRLNQKQNTEFNDIVLNRWNVTCKCPMPGYEWNSFYGMCIDVDECAAKTHNCHQTLESCVNLAGSFRCACKWGHVWSSQEKKCHPSATLAVIKLGRKHKDDMANKSLSIIGRVRKFLRLQKSSCNRNCINCTLILIIILLISHWYNK